MSAILYEQWYVMDNLNSRPLRRARRPLRTCNATSLLPMVHAPARRSATRAPKCRESPEPSHKTISTIRRKWCNDPPRRRLWASCKIAPQGLCCPSGLRPWGPQGPKKAYRFGLQRHHSETLGVVCNLVSLSLYHSLHHRGGTALNSSCSG